MTMRTSRFEEESKSASPRSECSVSSDGEDLRPDVRSSHALPAAQLSAKQHEKPAAGIPSSRTCELPQHPRIPEPARTASILPGGQSPTEPCRMMSSVRMGEYSPLNPALLSPGQAGLGLGEYEEKRRQLLMRKKQEFREYLAQARMFAKDQDVRTSVMSDVSASEYSPTLRQTTLSAPRNGAASFSRNCTETVSPRQQNDVAKSTVSFAHAGTNTTPMGGGDFPSSRMPFAHAGTNTNPRQVSLPTTPLACEETIHQAGGDNQLFDIWDQNNVAKNQAFKYLSPRERKMADLQVSGLPSPSFLSPSEEQGVQVRSQRDTYKEELRKQIAEKRRIDAEKEERERREDEAMARRVERQQERMRRDFLREQEQNNKRQEQRQCKAEEVRCRQVAQQVSEQSPDPDSSPSPPRPRLRPRQHTESCPTLHDENKRLFSDGPRLISDGPRLVSDGPRLVSDGPRLVSDGPRLISDGPRRVSDGPRLVSDGPRLISDGPRLVSDGPRLISDGPRLVSDGPRLVSDGPRLISDGPRLISHGQTQSNKRLANDGPKLFDDGVRLISDRHTLTNDGARLNNGGQTPTYDRLTSDLPRLTNGGVPLNNGGGHTLTYDRLTNGGGQTLTIDHPRLTNSGQVLTSDHPRLAYAVHPEGNTDSELSRMGLPRNVGLEDSLPIPVFRAASPVIPAVRTSVEMGHGEVAAGSRAMQALEAKWQVPAVQKNNMVPPSTLRVLSEDAPNSRQAILTQLGAFRRHLQMEQMKMEEKLRKRNEESVI